MNTNNLSSNDNQRSFGVLQAELKNIKKNVISVFVVFILGLIFVGVGYPQNSTRLRIVGLVIVYISSAAILYLLIQLVKVSKIISKAANIRTCREETQNNLPVYEDILQESNTLNQQQEDVVLPPSYHKIFPLKSNKI